MTHQSLWTAALDAAQHPQLEGEHQVDSLVIGGGITGLTTALKLVENGQRVAVVEARTIGGSGSSTSHSTGNLYAPVSEQLSTVARKWNDRVMHQIVQSRTQAVDFIESTVREHGIDCQFVRCPWVLYAQDHDAKLERTLEQEYQAALDAGLPARLEPDPGLPFAAGRALRIERQAQFNPFGYLQGLARVLRERGASIFEHSPVTALDARQGEAQTPAGRVRADTVVVATHTPKGISLLHTELEPHREYGIALRLDGEAPPTGIFWQLGEKRTIRTYEHGGSKYLVIVGEKHKVGQNDQTESRYERLEQFARGRFAVGELAYRWSAQNYQPADTLPYIGRSAKAEPVYVATGFATDGLVYGTVAGLTLGNQILGHNDPLATLYDPRRITPVKSAPAFAKANASVAKEFVKDFLARGEVSRVEDIPPGAGRLLRQGARQLAVYRDENGEVTALSPLCPHMGCHVHWNAAERSWDCPCHGSRFGRDGSVIEGPALKGLARKQLD